MILNDADIASDILWSVGVLTGVKIRRSYRAKLTGRICAICYQRNMVNSERKSYHFNIAIEACY
jgi:hypothetical protein